MIELRDLQLKELEILKYVTSVCDQLNIKYSLSGGTLLGAIRHNGFIPWDDDIDLHMLRDDYNRFINLAPQYLPHNIKLQHYSTEIECPNIYLKVRDENTLFQQREDVNLNINHGIFIDIFPIDRIYNSTLKNNIEFTRRYLFNKINGCYDLPYIKTIVNPIKRFIGYSIHYSVCKLHKRNSFIMKEDLRRQKLNSKKGEKIFIHYYKNITGDYKILDTKLIKHIFEDDEFCIIDTYDAFLTLHYGDYMEIPPESERITHKPLDVKIFNNS